MKIKKCNQNIKYDFSVINNPIIYYAHNIDSYNTKDEEDKIDIIKNYFMTPFVINPNGWIYQGGNEQIIMNQCFVFVEKSDIVVFSTIKNNIIGRGVYEELRCAFKNEKIVYLLKNKPYNFTENDFNEINIIYQETKDFKKYAII